MTDMPETADELAALLKDDIARQRKAYRILRSNKNKAKSRLEDCKAYIGIGLILAILPTGLVPVDKIFISPFVLPTLVGATMAFQGSRNIFKCRDALKKYKAYAHTIRKGHRGYRNLLIRANKTQKRDDEIAPELYELTRKTVQTILNEVKARDGDVKEGLTFDLVLSMGEPARVQVIHAIGQSSVIAKVSAIDGVSYNSINAMVLRAFKQRNIGHAFASPAPLPPVPQPQTPATPGP